MCIVEALYDAEAILSNTSAFKPEETRTLRDQIVSNLERAWEITGRSDDELTGVMVQISQVNECVIHYIKPILFEVGSMDYEVADRGRSRTVHPPVF